MIEWCREIGKKIGVVVVTKHSDGIESGRKPRVVLACERSGEYRLRAKKTSMVMLERTSSEK